MQTPAQTARLTAIHALVVAAMHQVNKYLFSNRGVPIEASQELAKWVEEVAIAAGNRITIAPANIAPWASQAKAAWRTTSDKHDALAEAQQVIIDSLVAKCGLNSGLVSVAVMRIAKTIALVAWYIRFDKADQLPAEVEL